VYEIGFSKYQLGYAGAISVMLFVTILIVTVVQLRLFRERTW
jgi:multiple sugar transport system permease protein